MDRLAAMSVIVAVGATGSLSGAARQLGMPLPTVSRKVSDLESHLATRLFNRSTRRLTLTDAGQAYLLASRRILEDVDIAERAASGEFSAPRGELVISAPIVFGRLHVLPTVTAFLASYPEVNVRLVLGDRWVNLLEEHVDLAVRIGELADSSLVATRCGTTRRVLCGSPDYFSQHTPPKRPADLAAHSTIAFGALSAADSWTFRVEQVAISVPIRPRLAVNTAEAAIDAAIAGLGVTQVLSYQIEEAVKVGKLVTALKRFESTPVPVSLVYSSQRRLPLKVRAFLDFALPRLRARGSAASP
jgi:DNA-binding transcriptional LysR family regulator